MATTGPDEARQPQMIEQVVALQAGWIPRTLQQEQIQNQQAQGPLAVLTLAGAEQHIGLAKAATVGCSPQSAESVH